MRKIKPADQIDKAVNDITELIAKVEQLSTETITLQRERDKWMKQALADRKIYEGILQYHYKVREVLKPILSNSNYTAIDLAFKKIKPPKLK